MSRGNTERRRAVWARKYNYASIVPCCHCKTELVPSEFTLEHIVPVSISGQGGIGNWDIACFRCNNARGADVTWNWDDANRELAKKAAIRADRKHDAESEGIFESFLNLTDMVFV